MIKSSVMIVFLLVVFSLFLASCTSKQEEYITPIEENFTEEPLQEENIIQEKEPVDDLKVLALKAGYIGKPLAGKKSFYIDFNMKDYNYAIENNKLVLLNFHTMDCTLCNKDNDAAIVAFTTIDYDDVVGFRVLLNNDSTSDENRIALQHGILVPNTKIIIKGGKRVFKVTDNWNAEQFIDAIERNMG
ncbi:MAG: hypothetical protein KatS3mg002_0546 [Candidatus Woesearchaeota archaeon]|nr:MAG: hypothetical protein KatS3mg002_0546 [Candidatus Woesearchaeota archaeon]